MKLSVIIPVYNTRETLRRCVETVLRQQQTDMEVILVDDGSADGCQELMEQLAAKDHRLRVYHQTNQGLSVARNSGINIATGDVLTFIDSDDALSDTPLLYHDLLQQMEEEELDLIEYSVHERIGGPHGTHTLTLPDEVYTDMRRYWLHGKAYQHCYACNKLYRKALFDDVRFPAGKHFEDVYTLPLVLAHCSKIATSSKGYYDYAWNPQGITATARGHELRELLEGHRQAFHNKIFALLDTPTASLSTEEAHDMGIYYAHLLNIQLDVYEQTGDEPILPVMPYYNTWKLKLMHLLGIKRLCQLNKLAHSILHKK
ncbi:MAG: glycosyltransferase family 2 protein [Prevotella sp.]|uniref:glycosyltransferase family 2 protein n=1 Tax=Prevotella sp. AGR2160 TaxID=1280674 RepID=UPI000413875C|nr:glycosyltransferase family 2 protein [Prevotella sp. AGR2160]MDD5862967.1 glycosyltransferase family 2 protein [Prevotella sp.]